MKPSVLKEVVVTFPMAPEMELLACEKASAIARSMGMSQDKIDEVKMAVIEACLNALEHSQAQPRQVQVTFSVLGRKEPEALQITVRDSGVGFAPSNRGAAKERVALSKRGWGLQIIEGLMDEVRIESGAGGTTVVMCKAR
ncbi:MAG TPA: ATP-binding protein [Thermoanaerobaculia bacterium]|nr:ATP-binding protein [Thermoanaerobaculia bacterium]